MFHRAIELSYKEETVLSVTFQDGSVRDYDVSTLYDEYPQMKALDSRKLFLSGRLLGSYGIVWNEELDLAVEEVYVNGKLVGQIDVPVSMRIGNAISEARNRKGLTQTELARLANVDQSDLSKIECGESNPTIGTLDTIAKALGCSISLTCD